MQIVHASGGLFSMLTFGYLSVPFVMGLEIVGGGLRLKWLG